MNGDNILGNGLYDGLKPGLGDGLKSYINDGTANGLFTHIGTREDIIVPDFIRQNLVWCIDAGNYISYNGSGFLAKDLSPNFNNLVLGGVSWDDNLGGNFISYGNPGGTTSTLGTLGTTTLSNTTLTFEMMVYNSPHASLYETLFNMNPQSGGTAYWWCIKNPADASAVYWEMLDSANAKLFVHSGTNFLPIGEWTHFAIVADPLNKNYKFYKNGVLFNDVNLAPVLGVKTIKIPTIGTFYFGSYQNIKVNYVLGNAFFPMRIGFIRMYNTLLSPVQIAINFTSSKRRFGL